MFHGQSMSEQVWAQGRERGGTGVSGTVELGDGIAGLWSLDAGSAALVLSDLPSGETQAEFDVPVDLARLWPAVWHAVGDTGRAVLMASSLRFAAALFDYDLVWSKSAATGFLNAKSRPLRAHEFILVFSRGRGVYVPQMVSGASPIHRARRTKESENYGAQSRPIESRAGATDRYPTSVLEFATVGTSSGHRRHPQQKPDHLLWWLIASFTEPDALVVDPCAGSGSTGHAAAGAGRRFRGWDISPRFGDARAV